MKSATFYFGLETRTDGATKIGTDPENIAKGKFQTFLRVWPLIRASRASAIHVSLVSQLIYCRNRDRSPRRERDRDRDRRDRERRHRDRDKSDRDRREVRTTHFYRLILLFFNAHQKRRSAQVLKWQNCRQNLIHKVFIEIKKGT